MNLRRPSIIGALLTLCAGSAAADAPPGRFSVTANVYDTKTKLTWQHPLDANSLPLADAASYCAGLPGGAWRLPSVKELQTIVDDSRVNPAIDPAVFPDTPAAVFWASDPVVGSDPPRAWWVNFNYGNSGNNAVTTPARFRCVRSQ